MKLRRSAYNGAVWIVLGSNSYASDLLALRSRNLGGKHAELLPVMSRLGGTKRRLCEENAIKV